MKRRIGVQKAIAILAGVAMIFLARILVKVWKTEAMDELFDLLGMLVILLGFYIRMSARGYKQDYSKNSNALVDGGLYAYTRNPMYIGTFLGGLGVVISLLHPWTLIVFVVAYAAIYIRQIMKEEKWLIEKFGTVYQDYCCRVPRVIPRFGTWLAFLREVTPSKWEWVLKEALGCLSVVALVIVAQTVKDVMAFGIAEAWEEPVELILVVAAMLLPIALRIREE